VLKGGRELLEREDPFEIEVWASEMLGLFYKMPVPMEARLEIEKVGPAVVEAAAAAGDAAAMAVLRAFQAVAPAPLGSLAAKAAAKLKAAGAPEPVWADEIGRPEFIDAWMADDPWGDQRGYYMTFRYKGRPNHMLLALYDENLGGIIKDASAGLLKDNPRPKMQSVPNMTISDADPAEMSARILKAVETGDMYWDNDWTVDFKKTRALVLSRMRLLPKGKIEDPKAFTDADRQALVGEFRQRYSGAHERADEIADTCVDYGLAYGYDPLRWSPIAVELFMLSYLPRKVSLDTGQVRAFPAVLREWVRFVLEKKGLAEQWIGETEKAVDAHAAEFRRLATDPSNFGPAKAIGQAMTAAGVDLSDPAAVKGWMDDFNSRPFEERDQLFAAFPSLSDPA